MRATWHTRIAALAMLIVAVLTACTPAARTAVSIAAPIRVVAAENVWGSLAAQLGGDKVTVTSLIVNPNADPHDYEPTVPDARAIADSRLLVMNGAGYDPWAARLLAASPDPARQVIDVGVVAAVAAGGNPHCWYAPQDVHRVAAAITRAYQRLDPADAAYFQQQRTAFESEGMAGYDAALADIRTRYAGTPIGASESLVEPLASALGLKVLTPRRFLSAVSEGGAPSAADKATADAQIRRGLIKVFIYNRQNATPDVAALVGEAHAAGVPVVPVTETLMPASATFQDWQTSQLRALAAALHEATGR